MAAANYPRLSASVHCLILFLRIKLLYLFMSTRFFLSILLAAGLGLAWDQSGVVWLGPALSLGLIPLVLWQGKGWRRFLVALAYYLAGSHGIPGGAAVFFGPGHTGEGIALWLASSAGLALGWSFADRPWKVAIVLLFDAVIPPLALFDWMSPLAASGVLFPGIGVFGVISLLAVLSLLPWYFDIPVRYALFIIIWPIALNCIALFQTHSVQNWEGVNLKLGPSTKSIIANTHRLQNWVAVADRHTKAKVLLLPETLLTWEAGSAQHIEKHVPVGQTWLVGAAIPVKPGLYADGIEAVTHSGSKMVFESPFPVPVSMWMPWKKPSPFEKTQEFQAGWYEPVAKINGVRLWASICYDQLLPFVWIEASLQKPQVLLLTNNEWWARGTDIPAVQKASAWAWSRLIGASTIEAENY